MTYKLGWFSTGRDPAARELLSIVHDKIAEGFIPGELSFVFVSRERGESPESDEFIQLVESYNLPLVCFSSKQFEPELYAESKNDPAKREEWRERYDTKVAELLEVFEHDADVLAGYMLIVSPMLCKRFKMVNLHPATPEGPKGTWQEVIWELIRTGADRTGVMMHLVTEELDRGPPITFCSFPIRGGRFEPQLAHLEQKQKTKSLKEIEESEGEDEPYFQLVREEGVLRELPLIIFTLRSLAEGKVHIDSQKIYSGDDEIKGGYDLSDLIEEYLSK